jgi:hypothetical protein
MIRAATITGLTGSAYAECNLSVFSSTVIGVPRAIKECKIQIDENRLQSFFVSLQKTVDTCTEKNREDSVVVLEKEEARYPDKSQYCDAVKNAIESALATFEDAQEENKLFGLNDYKGPVTHACTMEQTQFRGRILGLFVAGTMNCKKWAADRTAVMVYNQALKEDMCVQTGQADAEDSVKPGLQQFHDLADKYGQDVICEKLDRAMGRFESSLKASFGR